MRNLDGRSTTDGSTSIKPCIHTNPVPHTSYRKVSFQLEEVNWQNPTNSLPAEFLSLPEQKKASNCNRFLWIVLKPVIALVILAILLILGLWRGDSRIIHETVSAMIDILKNL